MALSPKGFLLGWPKASERTFVAVGRSSPSAPLPLAGEGGVRVSDFW